VAIFVKMTEVGWLESEFSKEDVCRLCF